MMALIWFLPLFLVFLMVGLPVVFGMLAAPGLILWLNGQERDLTLLYAGRSRRRAGGPRSRGRSTARGSAGRP